MFYPGLAGIVKKTFINVKIICFSEEFFLNPCIDADLHDGLCWLRWNWARSGGIKHSEGLVCLDDPS
jgi:hypothetical protein